MAVLRSGVRSLRRRVKEGSAMRKASDQRGSSSPAAEERNRRNQHSGAGGGDGSGRGWRFRRRRERRTEEMRDSRVRVWEGRRRMSFWERKE